MKQNDNMIIVLVPAWETFEGELVVFKELSNQELLHYHRTTAAVDVQNLREQEQSRVPTAWVAGGYLAVTNELEKRLGPEAAARKQAEGGSDGQHGAQVALLVDKLALEYALRHGRRPPTDSQPAASAPGYF
ncbi:hypothetical protein NUH88_15890 [Nisaea acidiphila]|uniref:Uncharacterized protein n=1 Tax=Nisaea acidiphila TaxID=1862145 RepID=A0A9J7ARA6_9PROT|nr:hypothetical protein [Nisaea acidiphila]UUX48876.1 hypothetical protein NUH88_15890 [Nisaea acidiphila]